MLCRRELRFGWDHFKNFGTSCYKNSVLGTTCHASSFNTEATGFSLFSKSARRCKLRCVLVECGVFSLHFKANHLSPGLKKYEWYQMIPFEAKREIMFKTVSRDMVNHAQRVFDLHALFGAGYERQHDVLE